MKIALKDTERIMQIYRQSPFVLIHPILISSAIALLMSYLLIRFEATGFLQFFLLTIITLALLFLIKVIIIWKLNYYVVTSQRLLQYGQKGLFDQTVVETPHERILNVSYKTEGIISRLVGFGDVVVQIVGLMEPIILKNISQPLEIKDYLWEMHMYVTKGKGNAVYGDTDATHLQERVGYTKYNKLDD
jgi:hypothetical protein